MTRTILFLFIISTSTLTFADSYVVIYFKSKQGTPYSVDSANRFLSQRSLDRRQRLGISIDSTDLPVNPVLLDSLLQNQIASKILYTSRWFNFAVILPGVNWKKAYSKPWIEGFYVGERVLREQYQASDKGECKRYLNNQNDLTKSSLEMLNIHKLHNSGMDGRGVRVAVLDAGFRSMPNLAVFDSLFQSNRIVATRDFVEFDASVFDDHSHGSAVTALMAGNWPGRYRGSAPGAEYVLVRTENTSTESRLEEYNWVVGIEFADSIGADIVNSSLGYNLFDDTDENYSTADLTGNIAICSRAAGKAVQKGIVVVSSAGNDGNSAWRYINFPSDHDDVIAVGAVDSLGQLWDGSSLGVSFHHYKPNVVARGVDLWVPSTYSDIFYQGSGTSYSAPLVAGGVACLIQMFPYKTPRQVLDALQLTANNRQQPNNQFGYGIPDFALAYYKLSGRELTDIDNDIMIDKVFYDRQQNSLSMDIISSVNGSATLEVFDSLGRKLQKVECTLFDQLPTPILIHLSPLNLPQMIFIVVYGEKIDTITKKVMAY